MQAIKSTSPASASSPGTGGETEDTLAAATGGSAPPNRSGRISPGLAARMNAISSTSDSHGGSGEKRDGEDTPPPPPALVPSGSSSSSTSKMSPGLAARMGKAIPIPMPGGKGPAAKLDDALWSWIPADVKSAREIRACRYRSFERACLLFGV